MNNILSRFKCLFVSLFCNQLVGHFISFLPSFRYRSLTIPTSLNSLTYKQYSQLFFRVYERAEHDLLDLFLPKVIDFELLVVEIGASVGVGTALVLQKLRTPFSSNIIVIEANPYLRSDFNKLLQINGLSLDPSCYFANALSYSDAPVRLSANSSSLSSRLVSDISSDSSFHVPSIQLESIPAIINSESPIVLIIDCEGSEIDLFRNAKDYILSRVHLVLIEINVSNYFQGTHYSFSAVVQLICSRGFAVVYRDGNCLAFLNHSLLSDI